MGQQVRIGIIDDDAIAVFGLRKALMAIGQTSELSIYENGQDAIEAFDAALKSQQPLPSILFVDLNMPVMDGWDFLDDFSKSVSNRNDWPEIYIMTSSLDVNDLEKAKIYGLEAHYLIKPVSTEDVGKIFEQF